MKNNKFLALIAIVSLVFTSCSSDETVLAETESTNLLKTFKLKRDATGAYSIDFDVTQNTKVEKLTDASQNSNEYLLSADDNQVERNISQQLLIDNNKLKVGFVDTKTDAKQFISITDDKKISSKISKLANYSIQGNDDGTFDLAFQVNDNVNVSFVYNEAISTHEVHLDNGLGKDTNFSRTLESEAGEPLKIDFVNHTSNLNAKSSQLAMIRKPKIIIQD